VVFRLSRRATPTRRAGRRGSLVLMDIRSTKSCWDRCTIIQANIFRVTPVTCFAISAMASLLADFQPLKCRACGLRAPSYCTIIREDGQSFKVLCSQRRRNRLLKKAPVPDAEPNCRPRPWISRQQLDRELRAAQNRYGI
jgi:hypothetical protein